MYPGAANRSISKRRTLIELLGASTTLYNTRGENNPFVLLRWWGAGGFEERGDLVDSMV